MLPVHAKWNMLTPKGEKEIPALAGGRCKKCITFGFIKLVLIITTGESLHAPGDTGSQP